MSRRKLYKVEGMQAHRDFLKKEILAVDGFIEDSGYTNGSTTFAYLAELTAAAVKKLSNDGWTVEEWKED